MRPCQPWLILEGYIDHTLRLERRLPVPSTGGKRSPSSRRLRFFQGDSMIYKSSSPLTGHLRVTFELPAALWADRICVVGDFNQWQSGHTPLRQVQDGCWRAVLDLPVDQSYHFHYLIDGEQHSDFHADGCSSATSGVPTSLLDTTSLAAAATCR